MYTRLAARLGRVVMSACGRSVQVVLEDEAHVTRMSLQRRCTERADGMEAIGAMWDVNTCPVFDSLLCGHVAAWVEGVGGRAAVNVEGGLNAHADTHHRPRTQAHGATPRPRLAPICAPRVLTLDVSAVEIDVWLVEVVGGGAELTRDDKGVESHGALRPPRIQLVHQHLQIAFRR